MQRRKHSAEFKQQVVQEVIDTGNRALVARRYELSPNLVSKWVKAFQESRSLNTSSVQEGVSPSELKQLEAENDQLKKLLGEKDLEISILRDVLKKKNPHLLKRLK
ncbi:transposase [Bacillus sp. DX4.1]|uniref:transposase n=1 Tax=Bacillus sp. DX4.1 TaxID=3055867 RepID=UPI0025A0FAC9|nr:transposase [Bacillus sp. DX4.1]MDM5186112.1 transposase [Bacillus sp. DX4.1]MDM5186289.1 transposase [Bacillus sp. DX4.1]